MNQKDSVVFPQIMFSAYDFHNDHEDWTSLEKLCVENYGEMLLDFFLQLCKNIVYFIIYLWFLNGFKTTYPLEGV